MWYFFIQDILLIFAVDDTISAGYATDLTNALSLTLANTDSVSTQVYNQFLFLISKIHY
jgi:hypothetical protein